MQTTRLILVGGFLGAGKTTLIGQAAQRLVQQGKRVGLIANDQAPDMVDTAVLQDTGTAVEEISGGCFCCRFPDMVGAMQRLIRQIDPDVLIGEPVGSCTDLSATVLQPLKDNHNGQFRLAPFSVLVDGNQARVLHRLRCAAEQNDSTGFPDNVLYIYQKQLEEADVIVLNKADLLSDAQLQEVRDLLGTQSPGTPILQMSALDGQGVDAWLDFVSQDLPAGRKITEVDYDTYAAGEAALGWMNASASLHARDDVDWSLLAGDLLEAIRNKLRDQSAEIAHLKLYLTAGGGHLVGNVTSNEGPLSVRGSIDPSTHDAKLLINARVHAAPDRLRTTVEDCLRVATEGRIDVKITQMRSFFPGRPQPTHRYGTVVEA